MENEKEKKRAERAEKEKNEKEKIMKEKEKKRENKFRCEYCNVKLTTRVNYCGHLDICLEKYKKIIKEKEKIIEEYKNTNSFNNSFNNSCPSDENNIIKETKPITTEECRSALTDVKQTEEVLSKNYTNNKLEKEINPIILSTRRAGPMGSNKPLVLNDMTIEVDQKSLMINATQMCKAAGKLFANYKQLDGTKDYLQAL